MTIQELLKQIRDNYQEAGADQLDVWLGQLVMEFSWIAENIANCKKDRALAEVEIKKAMIDAGEKPTENMVERQYYTTEQGMFLAYNQEMVKAIGKMISFIRFRLDALRGKI